MDTLNNRRGLSVSGIMLAVAICGSFLALGAGAMGDTGGFNLVGDVNNDCIVNILDLAAVGMAFGSSNGSENWNPAADVYVDGEVNIFDMAGAGLNFGRTYSSISNGTVPLGWRLAFDYSNLCQLASYNAVTQIGWWDISDGLVKFEDNSWVPVGWRIWFLDDGTKPGAWDPGTPFLTGRQPVGVFDIIDLGMYNMDTGHAIRGDKNPTTQVDEGATETTFLTLAAEELVTHKFYAASFTSGHMLTTGFAMFEEGEDTTHNILIDRTQQLS